MYSKSSYSRHEPLREERDELSLEEAELLRYGLPPRYDGSRFSSRMTKNSQPQTRHGAMRAKGMTQPSDEAAPTSTETTVVETAQHTAKEPAPPTADETESVDTVQGELARLFGSITSEELLIISLILTVAGSKDGGELMLFLILLLLHG